LGDKKLKEEEMSEYPEEVTKKIKDLEIQISDIKKTSEDVKLVKRLFPKMVIWVDRDVNCCFPVKSMNEVKNVLKTFAEAGIMLDHFNNNKSNPVWYLKGKNVRILLNPQWADAKAEGATCRLVCVGEVVRTYPKFEVVCEKGEEL